jgi:hypothetical protein
MYRMNRIFCATSWELEEERRAFHDIAGQINETKAMPSGMLYVPVSLTNMPDKRIHQHAVNDNIRACRHYIVAISEDWGPKERNFERDYRLAIACSEDPALPMRHVAILLRDLPDGSAPLLAAALESSGCAPRRFRDTAEFSGIVRQLLSEWLPADVAQPGLAGSGE